MLYDIMTVFWRDWLVLKRRLGKFLLSRMVAPMLYLVAFGWGLGRSIPTTTTGGSYLDFLVPGILALNSMNISFNSVGPSLHTARMYHKSLEEYLVAPIKPLAFIIGKIAAGTLRGIVSSLIIIAMAYAFGANFHINTLFFSVVAVNCIIFSALGFITAMSINSHEDMGSVNTYLLLPMSFLCGTFFSPDKLPVFFKFMIEILPLTHTSTLLRSIGTGNEVSMASLAILLIYVVILIGICMWTMHKVCK
jgi:ABC-type multidrug transport system permease subunit